MEQQIKNLLTIVLPSYFNLELLKFWLNNSAKDNLFKSVDIYIALSESKENFDDITRTFNFKNLRFFWFDKTKTMEEKIFSISSSIKSKYVYLCGDGVLPNISNICRLIEEKNDDVYIIYPKKSHFYKVFLNNQLEKCKKEKIFYFLTYCGGSIVKRELFQLNLSDVPFKSNFCYPVAILNNLKNLDNVSFNCGDFYSFSPLKKKSTWYNSESIFAIWTQNYIKSIFLLNSNYDDMKPAFIRSVRDCQAFSYRFLLIYKRHKCLDINFFKKYKGYFLMTGYKTFRIYLIYYFVPTFAIRFLSFVRRLVVKR